MNIKSHIKKLLSLQNDITLYLNTEIALTLSNGQSSNQQVVDHISSLLEDALGSETNEKKEAKVLTQEELESMLGSLTGGEIV